MKRARDLLARTLAIGDRVGTDAEYAADVADSIREQQLAFGQRVLAIEQERGSSLLSMLDLERLLDEEGS